MNTKLSVYFIIGICILNLFDAFGTSYLLSNGHGIEANPIMNWLITNYGYTIFIILKCIFSIVGLSIARYIYRYRDIITISHSKLFLVLCAIVYHAYVFAVSIQIHALIVIRMKL